MLAGIYLANRAAPIDKEDTLAAQLLPLTIIRGEGPHLDRFEQFVTNAPGGPPSWSMTRSRGHIVSRYSIGSVLVTVPIVAVHVAAFDRFYPGWDRNLGWAFLRAGRMSKVASAIIVALTAVAIHRLLRQLGIGAMAVPATLAAALGSDLWAVASQAPWEHGPAALMLTLSMILLTPRPLSRYRLFFGGITTALMVCCRQIDLIFAIALLLRVLYEQPRSILWFLIGPLVLGSGLITYNWWYFGSIVGGHAQLEALHPVLHGVQGTWTGNLLSGLAGTLLSPNRGLLVFSPWIIVALATLPMVADRVRSWPLGLWLSGALLLNLLALSKYSIWWGGHTFGPRYWIDTIPIFAVLLGFGLDWAWTRCRLVALVFGITIVLAIGIQAIGAFYFPSSWNTSPADIDRHPERVWNWSDTELQRCLREGVQPWSKYKDPLWKTPRR